MTVRRNECFPPKMTKTGSLLQVRPQNSSSQFFQTIVPSSIALNVANDSIDTCWKGVPIVIQSVSEDNSDNGNTCSKDKNVRSEGHNHA